jgi:hypothetical protein
MAYAAIMRRRANEAKVVKEALDALLAPYKAEVDGATFLGVPLSQLEPGELRAALVMMGQLVDGERTPQRIELSANGSRALPLKR